ncbi:hypothetical protein QWZ10_26200 [Paracoccus cavernae]|uniref:Uncharacterized protein n=1 Tax=Paracoccus cavernae TaxID=1571207 RepID=A0ABT8DHR2_9RHOB|nr:hypothetical protein [Paracoccus cavernae]MDN3714379.1 hypothetical protein [Paracoccus cavernae]MDN3714430.1 hypothetical protein [Paracoccus cavernae]
MLRRASEALKPSPSDIELDERASRTLDEMERRDEFAARAVVRRESDRIAKRRNGKKLREILHGEASTI